MNESKRFNPAESLWLVPMVVTALLLIGLICTTRHERAKAQPQIIASAAEAKRLQEQFESEFPLLCTGQNTSKALMLAYCRIMKYRRDLERHWPSDHLRRWDSYHKPGSQEFRLRYLGIYDEQARRAEWLQAVLMDPALVRSSVRWTGPNDEVFLAIKRLHVRAGVTTYP